VKRARNKIHDFNTKAASIFTVLLLAFFMGSSQMENRSLLRATRLFESNQFSEAIPFFDKAIKYGNADERKEATERIADCYRILGNFEEAEYWYKKLILRGGGSSAIFKYGMALKAAAKYAEAKEQFELYQNVRPNDPQGRLQAMSCDTIESWYTMDRNFDVKELKHINTSGPEYSPVPYGNGIIFSSQRKGGKKALVSFDGGNSEVASDMYYVQHDGTDKSKNNIPGLFPQLNTNGHEGTPTFTKDGRTVYFVKTVEGTKRDEFNRITNTLEIFTSKLDSGIWSTPENTFPHNSEFHSVFHPSVSPDGRKIIFASDMKGGIGGTDIYICYKFGNQWSLPYNLGPEVNTFDYELYPHFLNDSTFFFSSRGHPGMGGLDIYKTTFNKTIGWTNVENLRNPINSIGNDMSIVFEDPYHGFLVSDRFNGTGSADIYSFSKTGPREVIYDGKRLMIRDYSLFDDTRISISATDPVTNEKIRIKPISTNGYFQADSLLPNVKYKVKLRKGIRTVSYFFLEIDRDGSEHKVDIKTKNMEINYKGLIGEFLPQLDINQKESALKRAPSKRTSSKKRKPRLAPITMDEILTPMVLAEYETDNFTPFPGVMAKMKKGNKMLQENSADLKGDYDFFIGDRSNVTIEIDTIPENYKDIADSLINDILKKDSLNKKGEIMSDEQISAFQNDETNLSQLAKESNSQGNTQIKLDAENFNNRINEEKTSKIEKDEQSKKSQRIDTDLNEINLNENDNIQEENLAYTDGTIEVDQPENLDNSNKGEELEKQELNTNTRISFDQPNELQLEEKDLLTKENSTEQFGITIDETIPTINQNESELQKEGENSLMSTLNVTSENPNLLDSITSLKSEKNDLKNNQINIENINDS